jgi:transposase
MISTTGVRIWLATAAVDGRKGFDTLCGIVRQSLGHDHLCGDLFVFRNRSAARIKIIFWDHNGLVLYAKNLEAEDTHLFGRPAVE